VIDLKYEYHLTIFKKKGRPLTESVACRFESVLNM
jgi:hypothetical protein